MSRYTLLADIGGTNTRVALSEDGRLLAQSIRRYANAGQPALEPILRSYLAEAGVAPEGACVAAAGPVRDGVATMTNLDWVIEGGSVSEATGARRVAVLNDLQAQGHALGRIEPGMLREIAPGRAALPGVSQLVVGIGTGFNAAPVHEAPGGRIVSPSEGGHVTLPVASEADMRLSRFVAREHGFASVEDVLSGRGVAHVHTFVCDQAGAGTPLDAAGVMAALSADDPLARETARIFVRVMGAVIGDLALTHLPFGGIYLIGGVSRAFAPLLAEFGFTEAFRAKGRFADFMDAFPIRLIEDDYAALLGCAAYMTARE
ncbi:glucokinase [Paenirhodobacter sp.]|uniref:glucokinase n=1 Tax=Paenirhodobacter sp. TaxID=1965326 RepID=UPI003B3F12AA